MIETVPPAGLLDVVNTRFFFFLSLSVNFVIFYITITTHLLISNKKIDETSENQWQKNIYYIFCVNKF